MTTRGPRYSKEEFARRGQEIYDRVVRPTLRPDDDGKFVAIDIESGEYEMEPDDHTAVNRLWHRLGDPQLWLLRIGSPAAHRIRMSYLKERFRPRDQRLSELIERLVGIKVVKQ
jgi:hypothetical protein